MANKPVVPSTTQNNWNEIRSRLDSALKQKAKSEEQAKAAKVASVTRHAKSVAEKSAQGLRNGDPDFDAKRVEGLNRYFEKRRLKKQNSKKIRAYRDKNGLVPWCILVPSELHDAFKKSCIDRNLKMSATVCELILEFITKPDSK